MKKSFCWIRICMWRGSSIEIRLSIAARIRTSGRQCSRGGTAILIPPRSDEKIAGFNSTVLMSSYLVTDQNPLPPRPIFDHMTGASLRICAYRS